MRVFSRGIYMFLKACSDFWPFNKKNITRWLEDMNIIFPCYTTRK